MTPNQEKIEHKHTANDNSWEEDFKNFYFETGKYEKRQHGISGYIDFIRQTRQQAYEEGKEKGKCEWDAEDTEALIAKARLEERERIIGIIKKMNWNVGINPEFKNGYNEALEDLIQEIQK